MTLAYLVPRAFQRMQSEIFPAVGHFDLRTSSHRPFESVSPSHPEGKDALNINTTSSNF